MLHQSELMNGFWTEALLMVMHIINTSPSRPLHYKTRQEFWTGKKLDYRKLGSSDRGPSQLCQRMDKDSWNLGYESVFFLAMDHMETSDIDSRIWKHGKSSVMQ